ncbi:MAG: hypothetical protein MSD07_07130, partial [Bacteroidales bacterium]|nr:hypothetical protein [Bacteroidales bacterium]
QHFRDLMVASNPQTVVLLEMNDELAQKFVLQAQKFAPTYFYRVMDLCNYCDLNYRNASNKQFLVELTLIKICQLLTGPMPPAGGDQPSVKKMQTSPAQAPQQTTQVPRTAAPQAAAQTQHTASAPAQHYMPQGHPMPAPPMPSNKPSAATPSKMPPRIYINNTQRAAEEAAKQKATKKEAPAPTIYENKPIDPEQFAQAWNAYTQAHPHDIIVVNAMHRAVPTLVSGTHYKMKSANEGEAGMINNSLTSILTHLRNTLQNGTITLEIELDKTIKTPKIMTEREIVNDILSRRPEFGDFIKDFQLTLK